MIAGILTLLSFLVIKTAQGVQNAPQLLDVHGNSTTQRIDVLWMDVPDKQSKVIYEIEVYYTGQEKPTHRAVVERRPNHTHHWHWISPLPLQCLPHSVRLRYHNASEWTELRNVTGSGTDYSDKPKIYPEDKTIKVYPVGSRQKFCCIIPYGSSISKFGYRRYNSQPVKSTCVGQTCLLDLVMEPTYTGYAITCVANKTKSESTVFVGYSPEVYNFTCETRNLISLECSWKQGKDSSLRGTPTKTYYTLNGSSCTTQSDLLKNCSIRITPNEGEVAWTLTARNLINETNFIYVANPRHKVHLRAPEDLKVVQVNSRNATIQWNWLDANLTLLPVQCKVKITGPANAEEVRNETGMSLDSVILHDLHPYTNYSVRVQCASAEHFWKWGDWSEEITCQTKEDIPQAVDLWMAVDNNNRSFVIWKNLLAEQSHGELTHYQVLWGGSVSNLEPSKSCIDMSEEGVGKMITVTASNSIGHSPPSTLKIPFSPDDMETTRVTSSDGSLQLTWAPSLRASCGYVVDWYPVGRQNMCDIDWIKIPAGHTNVSVKSGLEVGVRYIFSLFACTSEAPELLQRWEGYGQELAPSEAPGNFHAAQDGMGVKLTWEEIPLEHRRGFIQGYEINYTLINHDNMNQFKTEIASDNWMQMRIPLLHADTYEFWICAFTSGGKSEQTKATVTLTSQISKIIVYSIISLGGVITLFLLFTIVCYWKRAWLKDKVCPDIPAPHLHWFDSRGIHDCRLIVLPPEHVEHLMPSPIPVSDAGLEVTNNVTPSVLLPLYRNVTDSQPSAPADHKFNSSMDASCSEFDNPTYNLLTPSNEADKATPVTKPADASLAVTIQGYKPQLPPLSTPMPLHTASSYQALMEVCQGGGQQQAAWTSELESDDYIPVGLLGSATSVSSSQPEHPYRFGHNHSITG